MSDDTLEERVRDAAKRLNNLIYEAAQGEGVVVGCDVIFVQGPGVRTPFPQVSVNFGAEQP